MLAGIQSRWRMLPTDRSGTPTVRPVIIVGLQTSDKVDPTSTRTFVAMAKQVCKRHGPLTAYGRRCQDLMAQAPSISWSWTVKYRQPLVRLWHVSTRNRFPNDEA